MSYDRLDTIVEKLGSQENLEALEKVVDRLPTLSRAVEALEELEETGSLETLVRLACLLNSLRQMLTDEMISGFASLGSGALDLLAKTKSPVVTELISAVADHPIELKKEIERNEARGLLSLLAQLRDPEVRRGLAVMLALLRMVGRHVKLDRE